jgi:hypothetical protein
MVGEEADSCTLCGQIASLPTLAGKLFLCFCQVLDHAENALGVNHTDGGREGGAILAADGGSSLPLIGISSTANRALPAFYCRL